MSVIFLFRPYDETIFKTRVDISSSQYVNQTKSHLEISPPVTQFIHRDINPRDNLTQGTINLLHVVSAVKLFKLTLGMRDIIQRVAVVPVKSTGNRGQLSSTFLG